MAESLKQRADRWLDEGAKDIMKRAEAKGKRLDAERKYPTYSRPQSVIEGKIRHNVNGKEAKKAPYE